MTILSIEQINDECARIVNRTQHYNPFLHACFQVLFNTGARCGEVCDLSLWQITFDGKVEWQTIKRGGVRSVSASLIPALFQHYILFKPESRFIASKRNLRSAFDIFSSFQAVYTLDKQISTHLFRHNRIKQLYADGWSLDDIRTYFAVGANEVPEYYVNSTIYVP